MPAPSPQITAFKWGRVDVKGFDAPFKDVKLWPGGARAWDWNETGTRHVPGIQMDDVQELLDHGADVIVLSKGVHERLQTMDITLSELVALTVEIHQLQTEQAVEMYNELAAAGRAVGALIHSTC
ncbi:MAG: Mth938-like domain-containing protein [Chloroflexota bacterium]